MSNPRPSSSKSRQRPPLHLLSERHRSILRGSIALPPLTLGLGPRIVVCELQPDLSRVFALARQALPDVLLAASGHDDIAEVEESLSDQIRLLVLAEDRDLEVVVVRRVVDVEADFRVPVRQQAQSQQGSLSSQWLNNFPNIENIPLRRLPAPLVNRRLLRLLAQARGAIGILLAHRLPVGQVLGPVADHDQGADLRPVDTHVGVDARGVRDLLLFGGGHRSAGRAASGLPKCTHCSCTLSARRRAGGRGETATACCGEGCCLEGVGGVRAAGWVPGARRQALAVEVHGYLLESSWAKVLLAAGWAVF